MSNKQVRWAPVNRAKGESMDHWLRQCRDAHQAAYIQTKIARGEWLPKEEYERLTGRPGKTLTTSQEIEAEVQRHRVANRAGTPVHEDTSLVSPDTVPPVETSTLGDVAWNAGESALWSGGMAAVFCAGKHVVQGDKRFEDAAVDVVKTGLKGGCRSGAVKLTEAGIEEGLRRIAAARAATTLAEQAGKAALKEAGENVAKEAGVAVAREAGKQITKEAAKQVVQQTARQAMVATLRGNAVGAAAGLIVDQAVDTVRLAAGSIDRTEYGKRTAENVGSAAGGLVGAAAGAGIGTLVCPGVGTAVGAFVGGILGSLGLTHGVRKLVR